MADSPETRRRPDAAPQAPAGPARASGGSTPAPTAPSRAPAPLPADEASGMVVAIMGGSSRKGSWEPPARLRVLAFMGGVELDFREADLLEGETIVEILAFMGGVKVVVPPDVDVQAQGTGFMGDFSSVSGQAREPRAPLLTISGLAVMGGVEVKVKKLPLSKRLSG